MQNITHLEINLSWLLVFPALSRVHARPSATARRASPRTQTVGLLFLE
ncbi:MAG: hypothetical protein HOP27_15260 [Anaerolineales bacterium]|nr:hypothetical protein [Anaerolineales bacterium]